MEETGALPDAEFKAEYDAIPGDKWIDKLRFAFNTADVQHLGMLSLDQWVGSKLRYLISETYLNDAQMIDYFHRVDADCDLQITWDEVVDYLLTHGNSFCSQGSVEKKLKIIFEAPDAQTMRKTHRATKNLRVMHLAIQGQIITLSETVLTVWRPDECVPVLTITDHDPFVDCCLVSSMAKLAVAKANRQIMFFDIRTYKKMDMIISATIVNSAIPKMTEDESNSSVVGGKCRDIPMFNRPTAMVGHPDRPILFVGDEEGRIEVFFMYTSRDAKYDWTWKRNRVEKMHSQAITQMNYLPESEIYLSSSMDGSLIMWRFDTSNNQFQKTFKFRNSEELAVTSFVYDKRTRDVVYTTNAHYFGVWRTFTQHYEHIETQREVVSTMAIVPLSSDSSFCVTVSRDNFATIYSMPNLETMTSYYMGLQHELCPPTGAIYVNNYLYLAAAFLSKWKCDDGANDGLSAHVAPIVKVIQNQLFDRILSIDKQGEFASWNPVNGNKTFAIKLRQRKAIVLCASPDPSERRIGVGYSNGVVQIIASNSGSVLSTIDKTFLEGGCGCICFATILKSKRILCCSRQKVVMFEDISGNRVHFVRNFLGHTEEVAQCIVLKERFVLSLGSGKELFLWNIQQQSPIMRYKMSTEPSIALDLLDDSECFVVGDVAGNLNIMSIESPTPLRAFKGIELVTKSSISTVAVGRDFSIIIVGNMHGYVKIYHYKATKFEEVMRFRAHTEAIISLAFSEQHGVITTAGRDEEIKLWRMEPFACIGSLGRVWKWNLSDPNMVMSKKPLPDDPTHFMEPVLAAEALAERERLESERNEETVAEARDIEIPPFSFDGYMSTVDDLETQCVTGRTYIEKATMRPDDLPRTARVFKPRPPNIMDKTLIDNSMMSKTVRLFEQIAARPKIWKPVST